MAWSTARDVGLDGNLAVAQSALAGANKANKDVKDLYDPNMMSVIEKQGTTARFAGETSRYNVMLESAKAAGIDTKAFEASYATLNDFMGTVIGEGDKASDVDREKYSQALNEFNNQMAQMQNALSNDYDNKMAANSEAVSEATDALASADARIKEGESAMSQGIEIANSAVVNANSAVEKAGFASDVSSQAQVTAEAAGERAQNALSDASNALSIASTNSDDVKIVKEDLTNLKGGSTLSVAELESGLQTKVSQSDFSSLEKDVSAQATTIEQTKSSVGLKADAATVDSLNGRVTANEGALKVANDNISQSVTNTSLEGKLSNYATQTWTQGKIDTTANAIKSTVSKVQNNIDNLHTVGTNLISGSDKDVVLDDTANEVNGWKFEKIYQTLTAGKQYTFSSNVIFNVGTATEITIATHNPDNGGVYNEQQLTPDSFGRIKYTVTPIDGFTAIIVYAGIVANTHGNCVTYHHYKLEFGDKATDWCLAPEDSVSTTQFSSFEQTVNGLQTTVSDPSKGLVAKQTLLADQYTSLIESRDNLVLKSWFDDGDRGGWTSGNVVADSNIRDGINGHANYLHLTERDSDESGAGFSVSAGEAYYFSGWLGSWATPYPVSFGLHLYKNDGAQTWISAIKIPAGTKQGMQYMTGSLTIPTGWVKAYPWLQIEGLATAPDFGSAGVAGLRISRNASSSQITQLQNDINLRVSKDKIISQLNLSPEGVLIGGEHVSITGKTHIDNGSIDTAAIKDLTADKITAGTIKANVKMSALEISGESVTGGNVTASVFSTPNKTFTVDKNGNITASSLSLIGNKNYVYNSELLGSGAGWWFNNGGHIVNNSAHGGTLGVNWNSNTNGANWVVFARSKQVAFTTSVDSNAGYSASVWMLIRQSNAGTVFAPTLEFYNASGQRIAWRDMSYTSNGGYHDWQLLTTNNLVPPADAKTVVFAYHAYNGAGDVTFSQPMISQSPKYQGYTSDTGNVLSSGQVILDTDGKLTTTYDGVTQDNEKYYRAWKLLNGTLSIGRGYITSSASGQRNISDVNEATTNVQGTLTAGYLKLTGSGMRTYADAGTVTISSGSTDYVVVDVHGITLRNGAFISGTLEGDVHGTVYGSLSGSVSGSVNAASGGVQAKAVLVGYSQHTINTTDGEPLAFQKDHGNSGTYIPIKASAFTVTSKASTKKDIRPYEDNGNVVANTNLATYLYKGETYSENAHMGPILDDTMGDKQYYTRQEITLLDGSGIDTTKAGFYGWSAIKALQRENEQMQIRLRKLEITEETNNG